MVYDTLDKANLFADTMEESFQENSEPYDDEHIEKIRISSTQSRTAYASAGCPQGSLLSPLLYNLFTHDFPTAPTVHICLFADDAAIISQACNPDIVRINLQKYLKNSRSD
ncbi:hypothetical protein TNCV_3135941 [Trichonephila clavipes]|nr:hypothetical protein TNCV_3135941 [Trichonephila clavipes]